MATPKTEKKVVKKPAAAPKIVAPKVVAEKASTVAKAMADKVTAPKAVADQSSLELRPTSKPVAPAQVAAPKVIAAPKAPAAPKVVAEKAPVAKATKTRAPKVSKGTPVGHGVGRRKSSVARVWLRRNGEGKVTVNNLALDVYFDTALTRQSATTPFRVYALSNLFDADVNVVGGGKVGQADAVKLAISRAFLEQDETLRPVLRKAGLLTVDSRVKERKKYGQKAARRKFQFVKR